MIVEDDETIRTPSVVASASSLEQKTTNGFGTGATGDLFTSPL